MNANPLTAGSPLWQILFVSFAVAFVLFELLRGWRLGLFRQLVRVAAVIGAYTAAFFGGRAVAPYLRETIKAPDVVISSIAGAVLALLVYTVIAGVGAFLFKRTVQHESRALRVFYGSTGAILGIFFGLFFVWLILLGVRSIGAIADAQIRAQSAGPARFHEVPAGRRHEPPPGRNRRLGEGESLTTLLARLKNSVELGPIGRALRTTDVLPAGAYQTVGKLGEVLARPESAQRFLSFPGARALCQHPKIVALQNDPEITNMIRQGRFVDLLQNGRLIDALNDPIVLERVKHFDFERALDYALEK